MYVCIYRWIGGSSVGIKEVLNNKPEQEITPLDLARSPWHCNAFNTVGMDDQAYLG